VLGIRRSQTGRDRPTVGRPENGQSAYHPRRPRWDQARQERVSGTFLFVDDLTVKVDTDANGSYETSAHVDSFDQNNGYAEDKLTHDAAGNLTYDGIFVYRFDAWNRLVTVKKAYRDSAGNVQANLTMAELAYDGLGWE
jgi:hypothetical protein